MFRKSDGHRRTTTADWLVPIAIAMVLSAVFVPILASAKERSANSTISAPKSAAMATSLYYADYDSNAPLAGCLQEGAFVSANGGCMDTQTGLVWGEFLQQQFGAGGNSYPNFYEARDYCANSNDNGFTDWRLPTKAEMQTAAANGARDYLFFGVHDPDFNYEFSSTLSRSQKYVWIVALGTGDAHEALIQSKSGGVTRYTRVIAHCVR